ncbi:MAG: class I SAM-dependent methyltransferase [Methanobrevibacter sp.]|nr:class I SAM-dependent methyltransferase [Methanobrevibacter sp.]
MKLKNIPENYETSVLEDVDKFLGKSEMIKSERRFLNGIIREIKPKKLLEIGIAAGGSSVVMLNAIRDIENSQLCSIDYNTQYYRDSKLKSGYLVEKTIPHLKFKWKLYTGGVSAKFIEEIAEIGTIDLCLIDTTHHMPGELLDILTVLPFMKKEGIIIIHDTNYNYYNPHGISCNVAFSVIKANKTQPLDYDKNYAPLANIGAFKINEDTFRYIDDFFFALSLNWKYIPNKEDMNYFKKLFQKYYSKENMKKLNAIYDMNKKQINIKNPIEDELNSKIKENLKLKNTIEKDKIEIENLERKNNNTNKKLKLIKNRKVVKYTDKLIKIRKKCFNL